jgi:hypothetical protein
VQHDDDDDDDMIRKVNLFPKQREISKRRSIIYMDMWKGYLFW